MGTLWPRAPVAAPDRGVYFSDFLDGGVYHFSPATGQVETVVAKRRAVGGMALHADGGLVMTGRDIVHVREGESRTLYANQEIPVLNDLTVDPDGHVIVGCLHYRPLAGEPPVSGEFIRLDGTVVMVAVGTPVTRRPPHRSPHARLTHEAPASGSGVKAPVGPGMHDARPR